MVSAILREKAILHIPQQFRGSANANVVRAMRLWESRGDYKNEDGIVNYRGVTSDVTRMTKLGPKGVRRKARTGPGRKSADCVEWIHQELRSELGRVCNKSTNVAYSRNLMDPRSERPLYTKIDMSLVQTFYEGFRIVSCSNSGKTLISPKKELHINRKVSYHLG